MSELIATLTETLGDGGVLLGADISSRAAHWKGGTMEALALCRPRTTEDVSKLLALCHANHQPVVAQGGKTSMVEGCVSHAGDIALSLERMNKIEEIDITNRTMTVQAGVPLQVIHEAANAKGLHFPLDLGARGSATIGGNISTNAGGNSVIRYGMVRNLVLGLEVVLADGTVMSSLNKCIKNNAGYDLKQLFIGSEGTLGIVTRAVLKLSPQLVSRNSALVACDSFDKVIALLHFCEREFAGALSAFEVMWNSYFQLVTDDNGFGKPAPMSRDYPFYVLIESQGADLEKDAAQFERILSSTLEQELIIDAVLCKTEGERNKLWEVRDNIGALLAIWPVFGYDISLPIDRIGDYLIETEAALKAQWPQLKHVVFGHLGDGNIHIAAGIGTEDHAEKARFDAVLYRGLQSRGGSISAEHGIGLEKKAFLSLSRSAEEIALMRTLKAALDPRGILNPDKLFE